MSEQEVNTWTPGGNAGADVFVHLPGPLYDRLLGAAHRERRTLAQVTRSALDRYLSPTSERGDL
jgi:hypothetical protein